MAAAIRIYKGLLMSKSLDPEILASLRELNSDDDPYFIRNFMDLFIKTVPDRITAIRTAILEEDHINLAREAHALKSNCSSVGANKLRELSLQLEQLGKSNSTNNASTIVESLESEFSRVCNEIRELPEVKQP